VQMGVVSEGAVGSHKAENKRVIPSPLNGAKMPAGKGRPPGTKNNLTNLREAVLEAFKTVGGPAYLARMARGTSSDRAAFMSLLAKVLPTQINANVDGGIKLELGWLAGRAVGTTTAQLQESATQVIELQQDSSGAYRISDPLTVSQPAAQPLEQGGQACADPHPPSSPGAGG